MRSDMGRVVIERPRRGSSHKSPKVRHFFGRINEEGDYDGLIRLPSSRYKIYGFAPKILEKEFTDVLGPLRRYLQKNVGRPWDKVCAEGRKALKSGGWGVQHVWDAHFLGEVDTEVFQDRDGKVWSRERGYEHPVTGFYVHPRTGLLRYEPRPRFQTEPAEVKRIALPDERYYVLIRGLWFIARYKPFDHIPNPPRAELASHGDALDEWPNFRRPWNKLWICRIEKSCNKKDLREIRRILEA